MYTISVYEDFHLLKVKIPEMGDLSLSPTTQQQFWFWAIFIPVQFKRIKLNCNFAKVFRLAIFIVTQNKFCNYTNTVETQKNSSLALP